jgi:adenylate cyclase
MKEIERKFLVRPEQFPKTDSKMVIRQGYLSVDPERIVRIRIEGDKAWFTVKGKISGITRLEFEYSIPVSDAEEMLKLSLFPPVEKIRHRLEIMGTQWEVDEFLGANHGLILAEVELEEEGQVFNRPDWLGMEVTGDERYYNSYLSRNPFSTW